MCTVSYIKGKDGVFITSNRDEKSIRLHADPPKLYRGTDHEILYPKDKDKNGTWIAAKSNGDAAVLLNGAFIKHEQHSQYSRSRGLILLEIINQANPQTYFGTIDLSSIEPFTLILFTFGNLYECRWDGNGKHVKLLDGSKAHIWSSATLYDDDASATRKEWFYNWYESVKPQTASQIIEFHESAGADDCNNGLIINREDMTCTVSITNLTVGRNQTKVIYKDLISRKEYTNQLEITGNITRGNPSNASLTLRRVFIKLFNWEYWPYYVVYLPVFVYWLWLSIKSRSLFFFSAANPLMENGGFAMASKNRIHEDLPQAFYPKTLLYKPGTDLNLVKTDLMSNNLSFPLIAKPDIGQRGVKVQLINNQSELTAYIEQSRADFLIQENIGYPNEAGIFYYRLPGMGTGQISGIVGKEYLKIKGDGIQTILQLLIAEPRYLLQLPALQKQYGIDYLMQILPDGETNTLAPYGNHCRGAKFIDLSHLNDERLTQVIDQVCKQIPRFYYGRLDIKYNTWEELCEGRNFSIIELNAAASEPAHIYDSKHSIFFAWNEIIRHWDILYKISKINRRRLGLEYMTSREGFSMIMNNNRYLKLIS